MYILFEPFNIFISFTSSEDPFEAFTLGLISALLVSGPNSPFYQALIESNIGSDYSPVVG